MKNKLRILGSEYIVKHGMKILTTSEDFREGVRQMILQALIDAGK